MVDVFEEVDEQFRSDHYKLLARRYLPWVAGVVLLGLAAAFGVWGYTRYQAAGAEKASLAYSQAIESLTRGDQGQAFNGFAEAAKSPSRAYRSLALMQQGGIRLSQQRPDDAVKLFDEASKAAPNPVLADAAALKAATVLMDQGQYAQVETRVKPLTDSKRPYAALAREMLAVEKLATGRANAARSDFVVLSLMADAPDDVKARARVAMMLIDSGNLSNLTAIIKAAKALPPAPAGMDAMGQGAPGAAGPDSETSQAGAAQ